MPREDGFAEFFRSYGALQELLSNGQVESLLGYRVCSNLHRSEQSARVELLDSNGEVRSIQPATERELEMFVLLQAVLQGIRKLPELRIYLQGREMPGNGPTPPRASPARPRRVQTRDGTGSPGYPAPIPGESDLIAAAAHRHIHRGEVAPAVSIGFPLDSDEGSQTDQQVQAQVVTEFNGSLRNIID